MGKKLVAEFIGTFFLVLAVSFTGDPIAIGAMLTVMVYLAGHISGAHFNPAVTFAFVINRSLDLRTATGYWLVQLLGSVLATFICVTVKAGQFLPAPAPGVGILSAGVVEVICTFALVIVILTVATAKKLAGNHIYGLAIGLTLCAIASVGGPISGGVYNPAVGIGPMLFSLAIGSPDFTNFLLYLIAPLAGSALARIVFDYLEAE